MIGLLRNKLLVPTLWTFVLVRLSSTKNLVSCKSTNDNKDSVITSCTNPLQYNPIPNGFTLSEYQDARSACIAKCNDIGYCCTIGLGGCEKVPCATGCHIAFFSEDVTHCKSVCDSANQNGCSWSWNHEAIGYAGFNPWWDYGVGVHKCTDHIDCGCPDDGNPEWGLSDDCSSHACAAGCDVVNDDEALRDLFFNGEEIVLDPKSNLDEEILLDSITKLSSHISSSSSSSSSDDESNDEMKEALVNFTTHAPLLDTNFTALDGALNLVEDYETLHGPLFLSDQTNNGFLRTSDNDGLELERTMLAVQQTVLENVYSGTTETLAISPHDSVITNCKNYLEGREYQWQTAQYFPGQVNVDSTPPSDSTTVQQYTIQINATVHTYWGRLMCFHNGPRIEPTGLYLIPGRVASVVVPTSLVNKGFVIQIGASTVDNSNKDEHNRMDRVTSTYKIRNEVTDVANPLGGGVYIKVPYEVDEGIVDVTISGGVVQAPILSMTSLRTTTEEEWNNKMKSSPAPWADFQTDLFLMQVPTSWIQTYDYDHLKQVLEGHDEAMAAVSEFVGYPPNKLSNYLLYVSVDLHIRHGAFGVGYPQVNDLMWSDGSDGPEPDPNHYLVSHPYLQNAVTYHELGHCSVRTYYRGEIEALVNLLYAYVGNVNVGLDFDEAFKRSFGDWSNDNFTPDNAMMHWMVTPNFRNGKEMDYSNTEYDEFRYQHRGYAKYADIARLFGWEVLRDFFHQEQVDFELGKDQDSDKRRLHDNVVDFIDDVEYSSSRLRDQYAEDLTEEDVDEVFKTDISDTDDRTLRLSIAAGVDLTPLIHFWGIHPVNPNLLRSKINENNLQPSDKVHSLLLKYVSLIPKDNDEFVEFFHDVYPDKDGCNCCPSPLYGCGWFNEWRDKYEKKHGNKAIDTANAIIDLYYPEEGCTGTNEVPLIVTVRADNWVKRDKTQWKILGKKKRWNKPPKTTTLGKGRLWKKNQQIELYNGCVIKKKKCYTISLWEKSKTKPKNYGLNSGFVQITFDGKTTKHNDWKKKTSVNWSVSVGNLNVC